MTALKPDFQSNMSDLLGTKNVVEIDGCFHIEFVVDSRFSNNYGTAHGGFLSAIIEHACGVAAQMSVAPDKMCLAATLNVSYLRSMKASGEAATVISKVTKLGKSVIFTCASIHDGQGNEIANGNATLIVK